MRDTFFVTTPIYYVNAVPHIGNAYTTVCCDVLARYHRQLGQKVLFATGTDEHALKVLEVAKEQGIDTLAYVDSMEPKFKEQGCPRFRLTTTSEQKSGTSSLCRRSSRSPRFGRHLSGELRGLVHQRRLSSPPSEVTDERARAPSAAARHMGDRRELLLAGLPDRLLEL